MTYVNHTFTSHLALSASLQPYAGRKDHHVCEFSAQPKQLALDISKNHFLLDQNGQIGLSEASGLGIEINQEGLSGYLVDVETHVACKQIFRAPNFCAAGT